MPPPAVAAGVGYLALTGGVILAEPMAVVTDALRGAASTPMTIRCGRAAG